MSKYTNAQQINHFIKEYLISQSEQCILKRFFTNFSWMYWTDWEEDPKESKRGKIERAWMDGTNRNVLLTSKTVLWPNGLSLDIPQGILYWVDAYYDRIEMVYLNNSARKVLSHRWSNRWCSHTHVFAFKNEKQDITLKQPIYLPVVDDVTSYCFCLDGLWRTGTEPRLRPVPLQKLPVLERVPQRQHL